MKKQNHTKENLRIRVLTFIAALAFLCANFQVMAFGTEDDISQTPLDFEFKKLDGNHDNKLSREEVVKDKDFSGGNFDRADSDLDGVLVSEEYSNFKIEAQQKRMEGFFDDSTLTAKVKAELIKDVGMKGLNISVETYKGQVILSGFVENDQQVRRAVQIATGVRGVQSVKNGLAIKG